MAADCPGCVKLREENRKLRIRTQFLDHEIVQRDDARGIYMEDDSVLIGDIIGDGPPRQLFLPLEECVRGLAVFGKPGVGKSTLAMRVTKDLKALGVRRFVIHISGGEWEHMFEPSEILKGTYLNPFDSLGIWSDDEIHKLVVNGFFRFAGQNNRGAVNLGSLHQLVGAYLEQYPDAVRNLRHFAGFVAETGEALDIPGPTLANIKGTIKRYLHDPELRRIFGGQDTDPALRDAIMGDGSACLYIGQNDDEAKSILATMCLMHLSKRYRKEYYDLGATRGRRMVQWVVIEETADILNGGDARTVSFMKSALRDSRKAGMGWCLIPRDQSSLRDIGVTNLMAEIGSVAVFQSNSNLTVDNDKLQGVIDNRQNSLEKGECILFTQGRTYVVKVKDVERPVSVLRA